MNRRSLVGALAATAAWTVTGGAWATTTIVCTSADRNVRFAVPASKANDFRAAVKAFATGAGYDALEDEGGLTLFARDFTVAISVTMASGEAYAGFDDDTSCGARLPPSRAAAWSRFLRFMAQRGYRGEPNELFATRKKAR